MSARRSAIALAAAFILVFGLAACQGSSGGATMAASNAGFAPSLSGPGCAVQISGDLSMSWQAPRTSCR
jgi:hypothetical protein